MKAKQQLPASKHFRLEELADSVYAVIHADGGMAIGNAGIVDLGDRTLIYDALFTPQAAEDLRDVAETLTGRPADFVIDSHWHNDHIWGNQVFGEATKIIATEETRRMIVATRGEEDFDGFFGGADSRLERWTARYEAAADDVARRQAKLWVDYNLAAIATRGNLRVRYPNVTFTGGMAFHGTGRMAELIPYSGHTVSDAVLVLPQDGIVFLSDLLFVECNPYLGDGDPEAMLKALAAIAELKPKFVVPGHGLVGTAEALAQQQQYIQNLDGFARGMVAEARPESDIDAMPVPPPYNGWLAPSFFTANMHFLYQYHLRRQEN